MRHATKALALAIGLSLIAAPLTATRVYADNPIDSIGDWVSTMGKSDLDKQAILTQRRAARAAAKAQREAQRQAKHASKEIGKAGKDAKKGLGIQ